MDQVKKDYRKFFRIFLILFILSFGVNLFLLDFYFKERKSTPFLPPKEDKKIQEVKPPLLPPKEDRKIQEAKPPLLPPKEDKKIQEVKAPLEVVPLPLVHIQNNDYVLICDKQNRILHLYRSKEGRLSLIKSYTCIIGSNNVDKKEAGDLATPEGIYFLTSFMTGKYLHEKYGIGAYALNYPNFLDRKEGKKGSGIWLHGYSERLERPPSSEGCVVVKDEFLKELMGFIKIGETPMVIVDTLRYEPAEDQRKLLQTLSHFIKEWETAWESRNTAKYLNHYSRNFVTSDGKDYQKFKEYKSRVNEYKKFIQLQIEQKAFLLSQKNGGRIAVMRINQHYNSDNLKSYSRKVLYLKEEKPGKWEIIGEVIL